MLPHIIMFIKKKQTNKKKNRSRLESGNIVPKNYYQKKIQAYPAILSVFHLKFLHKKFIRIGKAYLVHRRNRDRVLVVLLDCKQVVVAIVSGIKIELAVFLDRVNVFNGIAARGIKNRIPRRFLPDS